ncbi:MAG: type II secretion system F family protein [Phycisphaerales bacterium]
MITLPVLGQYRYIAFDPAGKRIKGVHESASERAAAQDLQKQGLTPVELSEQSKRATGKGKRLPIRRLAMAYQQLADLQRAGVPLLRALRIVGNQRANLKVASVFGELADEVADGDELSQAMANRDETFPASQVALIRAGEKAGILESVLGRLSSMLLAQAELRSKVIGSLIYPAVLMTFGALILVVVFTAFVPRFRPLFARLEGDLPVLTTLTFAISDLLGKYIGVTLIVIAVGVAGYYALRRKPELRDKIAVFQLQIPVFGQLSKTLAAARFCRLLGTLLDNGVPMISAMQIAKQASGHVVMARAIDAAVESVRGGGSIAEPLRESGLFEADVVEMISVAEAANNLGEVLVTIADTIDQRVDRLLTTAVRLVEPLLLVLIAVAVVLVAAALLLPMADLSSSL